MGCSGWPGCREPSCFCDGSSRQRHLSAAVLWVWAGLDTGYDGAVKAIRVEEGVMLRDRAGDVEARFRHLSGVDCIERFGKSSSKPFFDTMLMSVILLLK